MKQIFMSIFLFISTVAFAANAPDFEATDINGKSHKLSDYKGKVVVLEFINFGCPFVKKHYDNSGNIPKLQKNYTDKGVIWLSVCSSGKDKQGFFTADKVKSMLKKNNASPSAYLVDSSGSVGKAFGAKVTPHIFIIGKEGKLLYQGGIDSKKSTKAADIASAEPFVKNALDEILAGKPVSKPKTKAYGCGVKYAK